MHVRLLVSISGTRDGQDWPERGAVVELPDGEAETMVLAGLAAPVDEAPIEEATMQPVENASAPRGKRR